jgi:hypothetical protein
MRRLKKKGIYRRPSMSGIQDPDELNVKHLHREDEGEGDEPKASAPKAE